MALWWMGEFLTAFVRAYPETSLTPEAALREMELALVYSSLSCRTRGSKFPRMGPCASIVWRYMMGHCTVV